jgi:hypothetical protein
VDDRVRREWLPRWDGERWIRCDGQVREGGGDVWAQQDKDTGTPIQAAREQRHTHVLNWIQVGRRGEGVVCVVCAYVRRNIDPSVLFAI